MGGKLVRYSVEEVRAGGAWCLTAVIWVEWAGDPRSIVLRQDLDGITVLFSVPRAVRAMASAQSAVGVALPLRQQRAAFCFLAGFYAAPFRLVSQR